MLQGRFQGFMFHLEPPNASHSGLGRFLKACQGFVAPFIEMVFVFIKPRLLHIDL